MKLLSGKCLIDTNILVPLVQLEDERHLIVVELLDKKDNNAGFFLSSQNILELSSVLINAMKISQEKVVETLETLIHDPHFEIIYPNSSVLEKFLKLLVKYPKVHTTDLFLAATAVGHGVETVITNDKDFLKVEEIKVYNPFD